MRNCLKLSAVAAAFISTATCSTKAPIAPAEITTARILIQQLESHGATVALAEVMPQESNPYFSVNARRIVVNGESVSVFEYRDTATVNDEAARVDPSGTSIGGTQVTWMAPPRFYKSTRVIVVYVGHNQDVAGRLESLLGRPFAGVR